MNLGCFICTYMHFYIIFGTNLLTQGLVQIVVLFAYFGVSQKRNIKRNPNGMKPSRTWFLEQTWSRGLEVEVKKQWGVHEAGGVPTPLGAPSTLLGPSWLNRPTSTSYIYSYTLKTTRSTMKPYFHHRNLLYPRDPILRPFPELLRRGHRSRRASMSTPWPLQWCVICLLQTFGSIVIS